MTNNKILGYLKARREWISENDDYNRSAFGITKAEYDRVTKALSAEYGICPDLTPAGIRKALRNR